MIYETESGNVAVEGGSILIEINGKHGPPLLLIAGGTGTNTMYSTMVPILATEFRVIGYNRRNSTFPCQTNKTAVRVHADDAASIISQTCPSSAAIIFTTSTSAAIVLELIELYPQLVDKAILHEPILPCLLSPQQRDFIETRAEEAIIAYKVSGASVANMIYMPLAHTKSDSKALKEAPIYSKITSSPTELWGGFYKHDLPAFIQYSVDTKVILRHSCKIYIVSGASEPLEFAKETMRVLSSLLGRKPVVFVGGHIGYATHAVGFGNALVSFLRYRKERL